MTYKELNKIRAEMGLTIPKMAEMLGVCESTFKGWGTRQKVPAYIESSAKVHLVLHTCLRS